MLRNAFFEDNVPCNVIKSFIHELYIHLFFMNLIFYSEPNNKARIFKSIVNEKYKTFLELLNYVNFKTCLNMLSLIVIWVEIIKKHNFF